MAQTISSHKWRVRRVVIALLWLLLPCPAWGAEFRVAPMFQEVVIGDEGEVKAEVTLTNTTSDQAVFRLSAYDFGNLDDSGGVAFLGSDKNLDAAYALASWLSLDQSTINLVPGASATVTATIRNDATLAPGGHYGAVVFQSLDGLEPREDNGIAINHMIASLLFVKKTQGAVQSIELVEQTRSTAWLSLPKLDFTFRNTGNVHIVPRGVVRLTDPAGRLVARGIINEASALVLPETNRLFPTTLFRVERSWLPGWYTLETAYRFDGEERFESVEERLFLVPPIALASIGGGLALAFWYGRRRQLSRSAANT